MTQWQKRSCASALTSGAGVKFRMGENKKVGKSLEYIVTDISSHVKTSYGIGWLAVHRYV